MEKKIDNQIKNIFIHDTGNNLKNLSPNVNEINDSTILAKKGLIEDKKLLLLNGQIITSKDNNKNEIINFEQIVINLDNLNTTTIKKPKIQETGTLELLKCFSDNYSETKFCNTDFKKEIIATLNRRITIPFYIPIISLICALSLIKRKSFILIKIAIFLLLHTFSIY